MALLQPHSMGGSQTPAKGPIPHFQILPHCSLPSPVRGTLRTSMKQKLLYDTGPDISGAGTGTVVGLFGWNTLAGGPKEAKLTQGLGSRILSQEHWTGSLDSQLPPELQGLQAQRVQVRGKEGGHSGGDDSSFLASVSPRKMGVVMMWTAQSCQRV